MSEWPVYTVADLVKAGILDRPMDGNHGEIHPKTSDFVREGIPFVMASDLVDGRVDLVGCAFISRAQASSLRKGFARAGDILLSHKATIGRTAIVQDNSFPFLVLTPQVTYYRVKDKRRLSPRYLRAYFDSREFQEIFSAWAGAGSTRAYLGITAQMNLPVRMPPVEVQNGIADTISPIDDKIELNRRMNETLEAMSKAIFKDWFVDFGPTRAKMEGREPYLAPNLWSLFPDHLDADGKPQGWAEVSIYTVANVIYGAPFASSLFNTVKQGTPLLRIRDLADEAPGVWTTEEHPNGYRVQPGDIVVGMDGEFKAHLWGGADAWLNQRLCVFVPKAPATSAFVRNAIISPLAHVEATEIATTVIHLGKADIDKFTVMLPCPRVMSAFTAMVQPLYDRIVADKLESRSLAATRDLLLPKLMSGEVRVRDTAAIKAS